MPSIRITDLTPQARDILRFIKAANGRWVSRSTIAKSLGKRHLNKWSIAILGELVELKLIEVRRDSDRFPLPTYEYRFVRGETGDKDDALGGGSAGSGQPQQEPLEG